MIKSSDCQDSDQGVHHERHCGDLVKLIWHDGDGACLFVKRLERSYLLSGIDWRMPQKTWRPTSGIADA